jgi:phage-related baseplate assembly protein
VFTTDLELTIAAGATYGDVAATAETAGVGGNGYGIGTIKNPVVAVAYVNSIANQTTSSGGAEEESNEQLRLRIKEAPEQWSNAGSKGAYKFFTKSAHASIIDVEVLSPVPGSVYIYPLTTNGTPEQVVLDAVAALCSAETVRPLCDAVTVEAPTRKTFSIVANLTLFASADQALTLAAVQAALGAYAVKMRQALGRDLVLEEISALIMSVDGVYKPGLTQPAADIVNATNEWSDCTAMTVNVVGTAVG